MDGSYSGIHKSHVSHAHKIKSPPLQLPLSHCELVKVYLGPCDAWMRTWVSDLDFARSSLPQAPSSLRLSREKTWDSLSKRLIVTLMWMCPMIWIPPNAIEQNKQTTNKHLTVFSGINVQRKTHASAQMTVGELRRQQDASLWQAHLLLPLLPPDLVKNLKNAH